MQAALKLNLSWPKMFDKFENILNGSPKTTWLEIMDSSPPPIGDEANFDRSIAKFIKKVLHNKTPQDQQWIYMAQEVTTSSTRTCRPHQ
jgi:hypothetical protein